jgi:hypothetical protein
MFRLLRAVRVGLMEKVCAKMFALIFLLACQVSKKPLYKVEHFDLQAHWSPVLAGLAWISDSDVSSCPVLAAIDGRRTHF